MESSNESITLATAPAVPISRPRSTVHLPLYRAYNAASDTWEPCPNEFEGQSGCRMWSRFHHRAMTCPEARISTAAHLALAASQPAISIIEKRWSEETATSGKASSLSIISELAAFENFLLL